MRVQICALFLCLSFTPLLGCPAAGNDDDDDATDAGLDAGSGDAATDDAALPLKALGETCTESSECESARCLELFTIGTKYCSTSCTDDTGCDFGNGQQYRCLRLGNSRSCVHSCEDGASCGSSAYCMDNIATDRGAMDLCLGLDGRTCQRQADCAAGACTYLGTGHSIENFCDVTEGAGTIPVGNACDPDLNSFLPCRNTADCATGQYCDTFSSMCMPNPEHACQGYFCLNGTCGGPCAQDIDCPTDMACMSFQFQQDPRTPTDLGDDVFAPGRSCVPLAGSRTSCTRDADCTLTDEYCWPRVDASSALQQVCRRKAAGDAVPGERCADDRSTDTVEEAVNCVTGLCVDSTCGGVCQTAADCGAGGAAEWQCADLSLGLGVTIKSCIRGKACTRDADCGSGETCYPLTTVGSVGGYCGATIGTLATGQACDASSGAMRAKVCYQESDCTGFGAGWTCGSDRRCHAPRSAQCENPWLCLSANVCSQLCASDADCLDADWHCAGFPASVGDSGTPDPGDDVGGYIKGCQPFAGSKTACTGQADCQAADEVCRVHLALDGTRSLKCGRVLPGMTAEVGQACGLVGTAGVACRSDFCDLQDGDGDANKGTCGTPCVDSADCTGGLTCQDYDFSPWNTTPLKLCRKPGAGLP